MSNNQPRLTLVRFFFLLPLVLLAFVLGCQHPRTDASPKPIFDGRTLNGWTNRGQANFTVENGIIVGKTGKGGHGWLCTQKTYGDFVLELEVNITSGNSGVQIRSHINDKDVMVGYQIEVDPSARAWSGGLYEQGRRGWLQDLKKNEPARKAFKVGEWNKYRIVCKGDSIKSWVNDIPVTDYVDSMDADGLIALQVHAGKNSEVRFRNIRLLDLGKPAPEIDCRDSCLIAIDPIYSSRI